MDNLGVYAVKALTISTLTVVSLNLNGMKDLLWLFLAATVLDYIMGVGAAIYNKELNSDIGFRGIIKKVGAFAAIAVALIADQVAQEAVARLGAELYTGGAITTTVIIWFIINELISVLENLAQMNVELPSFLLAAVKLLKRKTDVKGADTAEDKDESKSVAKPKDGNA